MLLKNNNTKVMTCSMKIFNYGNNYKNIVNHDKMSHLWVNKNSRSGCNSVPLPLRAKQVKQSKKDFF